MAGNDAFYSAFVEIVPTAKGFERSLSKQIDGPVGSVGTSAGSKAGGTFIAGFGKMLPLLGGVLAAAGVGNIIADAISNGSDYQQAQGAVEDVFGRLGADAVKAFADAGAKSVGQSAQDILASSALLGIFGKAAGLADGDLVDFSENLITLGADLSSFANTSPEEAVEALAAGLRGESEPLRKYGILLDDATLKAKALEMGIYDGNGPLTQQQRILAANAVIFEQTAVQQGKFAEESDTLAGRQAQLAAGFENVSAKIGEVLLPVMEDLLGAVQDHVLPALEDFADWLQEPATQEAIGNFAQGLSDFIGKLVLGAEQINTFFTDMNNNEDLWFSDLGGKLALGAEQWGEFFRVTGEKFGLGAQQIGDFFTGVGGWFQYWADRLALGQEQVFGFFGAIGGKFALGAEQIGDFSRTVGEKVGEVVTWFGELPGKIGSALSGIGNWLVSAGKDLIRGFTRGITSMVSSIYTAITDTVGGAIDWAKDLLGIASPSKVFSEIGENTSLGFARGIEAEYSSVRAATAGMTGAAVDVAGGPTYVQNPFTGEYLLAQVANVASGVAGAANAAAARADNAGRRVRFA